MQWPEQTHPDVEDQGDHIDQESAHAQKVDARAPPKPFLWPVSLEVSVILKVCIGLHAARIATAQGPEALLNAAAEHAAWLNGS